MWGGEYHLLFGLRRKELSHDDGGKWVGVNSRMM